MEYPKINKYQSPLEGLLDGLPNEVSVNVITAMNELQYIKNYVSNNRPTIKTAKKDSDGRVIVDFSDPHVLSDMDYFRKAAIKFQKTGKYTDSIKSSHRKSSWTQFWITEGKKCLTYATNPDTGEWIPGDYYFYLNYSPIMRIIQSDTGEETDRVFDFPDVYDSDYLYYHYIYKARNYKDKYISGMHAAAIKCRGRGYSFKGGSMLSKRFALGDSIKSQKKVKALALASEKEYLNKDGILNKFVDIMTHCADNTGWGNSLIKSSWNSMEWKSGYQTKDGFERGRKNEVIGISMKDNPGKSRGKRAQLIIYEEFGKFPNLLDSYRTNRPSTEAGPKAFGQQVLFGTGGEEGSNFAGAEELIYHPDGYRILGIPNVYDKNTSGTDKSIFFASEVLNLEGAYDGNGNSDVTKALVFIMYDRYKTKYNSSDPMAITGHIAEHPISISEAIMRRDGTLFPIMDLKEYQSTILLQGEKFFDSHYVGELLNISGGIDWKPNSDKTPLRRYGAKGHLHGAVEIFELPKKNDGKVNSNRYFGGCDPYDDETGTSLGSIVLMDALTDRIVARYTGRPNFADEFYEICRRMLIFYNAKLNYENNKKGLFAYFNKKNSLFLLAETPQVLRDQDLVKTSGYGNKALGVNATASINSWARSLIKDWLLTPAYTQDLGEDGEQIGEKLNLHTIRSTMLIDELIAWNPDGNFDEISAMGMAMIMRADIAKHYDGLGGITDGGNTWSPKADDPYFN